MNYTLRKKLTILLLLVISLGAFVMGPTVIYADDEEETKSESIWEAYASLFETSKTSADSAANGASSAMDTFNIKLKTWAPVIAIGGLVFGVLVMIFSRSNKRLRRFGLYFAIAIPVLSVVAVYGISYLQDIFLA